MISIDVAKLRLSMKELERRKKQVLKAGDEGFRQKVFYLLDLAAKVSPQFSGDFASNWNIMVDGEIPPYKQWADKSRAGVVPKASPNGTVTYRLHQRGDMEAVATARARAAAQLKKVTRKSAVQLINTTDLHTDGTHMIGPDGIVSLRAVNIIPGRVRIESYLRARAREITK